jgi:hypothetical protein
VAWGVGCSEKLRRAFGGEFCGELRGGQSFGLGGWLIDVVEVAVLLSADYCVSELTC